MELSTQLDGTDIPSSSLDADANGDLKGLQIQRLSLDTLGGQLLAKGTLEWDQTLRLDLRAELRALDPGHHLADWPGSIDGRVQLRGELAGDGGPVLRVGVDELSGRLRDQPFKASGRLSLAGGRVQAEQVQIEQVA